MKTVLRDSGHDPDVNVYMILKSDTECKKSSTKNFKKLIKNQTKLDL